MSAHHCHKLIAKTAQEMAYELYDALMQRNDWYAAHKARHPGAGPRALARFFVSRAWPTLVPQARATLAACLANPIPEALKAEIHEALLLDRTLPGGKVASQGKAR